MKKSNPFPQLRLLLIDLELRLDELLAFRLDSLKSAMHAHPHTHAEQQL